MDKVDRVDRKKIAIIALAVVLCCSIVTNAESAEGGVVPAFAEQEPIRTTQERTMIANKRYLNFPVKTGAPKVWVNLVQGHALFRSFEIELASSVSEIDFWVAVDLRSIASKPLTLQLHGIQEPHPGYFLIVQADTLLGSELLYKERYRPQFHFSAQRGWLNDPNGLVFFQGEYHLFFQHNPYGWNWGNMTWGHAVSKDLVHWEELGDAIHPDSHGTIFSGSAVVDWENMTGFQTGAYPPIVCIYTYAGDTSLLSRGAPFTQALAYSNDRGRTWVKYAGNPVQAQIAPGNRDPKVIWHTPSQQWVIALYLEGQEMGIFTSKDLKCWERASRFYGVYECPELFSLPLDGQSDQIKWVIYGASGDYFIGEFDGTAFIPETAAIRFNYGDSFYASQTFNDIPPEDGRRIQISWGQTGHPVMPFNQMMNFPVELTLRETEEGPRIFALPVREIQSLHTICHYWESMTADQLTDKLTEVKNDLLDISLAFSPNDAANIEISVNGLCVQYDTKQQQLRCKEHVVPLAVKDGAVKLRMLADKLSVEIFGNQGQVYMPMKHGIMPDKRGIEIRYSGGTPLFHYAEVWEMASAWDQGKQGAYAETPAVYMANGIKLGEATQDSVLLWARLTKYPERNSEGIPFLSLETDEMLHDKEGTYVQTQGNPLESMEGSVPGAPGWIRCTYWPTAEPANERETPWIPVEEARDFTCMVALTELQPGTPYTLRVEAKASETSPSCSTLLGHFKTAPTPKMPVPVNFVVVTCGDYPRRDDPENGHKIYRAMVALNPDFFVHTGDIEYYDKAEPYAVNLELARFKWNRFFSLPFQRTFFQHVSSYFLKDDHDLLKNDCWPGQRYGELTWEQGITIFREQVPIGELPYRTVRWGKDLQIWLVEGREFRSPNSMLDSPEKTIWGKEQKEWFKKTVTESDATFRVLISPTPVVGPDRMGKGDNHANLAFAHEGRELRRFLSEHQMIVITGDRHWQYVSVDPEMGLYEFGTGPSSDAHSGGWDAQDIRPEHRYLNLKGGFLHVAVKQEPGTCRMILQHRGVEGEVYNEETLLRQTKE